MQFIAFANFPYHLAPSTSSGRVYCGLPKASQRHYFSQKHPVPHINRIDIKRHIKRDFAPTFSAIKLKSMDVGLIVNQSKNHPVPHFDRIDIKRRIKQDFAPTFSAIKLKLIDVDLAVNKCRMKYMSTTS